MKTIKTLKALKGTNLNSAIEFLKANFNGRVESPISSIAYFMFTDNKEVGHVGLYSMNGIIMSVGICGND
jgi:hypothetical protein